jgi:flagellar biogenesis protein FliO
MSQPGGPASKSRITTWASWGGIAIAAILLGILTPQLLPEQPAVEKPASKAEAKDKTNLEYTAPALPDAPSPQAMLLRLGLGTAVVLGLCVATLAGLRRWMNPSPANGSGPREMRLLETLQLGNRCSLHLVHLGNTPLIVGVDATGIKTIVPAPTPFQDVLSAEVEIPDGVALAPAPKLAA